MAEKHLEWYSRETANAEVLADVSEEGKRAWEKNEGLQNWKYGLRYMLRFKQEHRCETLLKNLQLMEPKEDL